MSTAHVALQQALEDLWERNRATPCHDRPEWVSDDADDLAYAAEACAPYPLLPECAAAAKELRVTAGVWSGHIYGQPARRKRKTA